MDSSKTARINFHFLHSFPLRDRLKLKAFIGKIFQEEKVKVNEVNYVFCSDEYLLGINRQYLGHDDYTDIITFNLAEKGEAVSGEIYISVERVRDNAGSLGVSMREEVLRVMFHGVLHLCGYKDMSGVQEKEMRKREDYYLGKFARVRG